MGLNTLGSLALASGSGYFCSSSSGSGSPPSDADLSIPEEVTIRHFTGLATTARNFSRTHFFTAINILQSARQEILNGVAPDIVDFILDGAMQEVAAVTDSELDRFPQVELIMVASALEAVANLTTHNNGRKKLAIGEFVPRVADLYRSIAKFLNYVDQQWHSEVELDPLEVFEQEMLLANVLLNSRGRLSDEALEDIERQQIAAHLTRVGSAAAALYLHEQGVQFPRLAEAFMQFFGTHVESYESQMFFPVHMYFEDAGQWRGDWSGDVDSILVEWLHELKAEITVRSTHPYAYNRLLKAKAVLSSHVFDQLKQIYGPNAPELSVDETLARFLAATPTFNSELSRNQLSLTDFLNAALRKSVPGQ
jgi:hypothetical protein